MSTYVSLKLVIDKKENRVLYGEANNKFIDFLFTLLALPVGTVINLLSTDTTVSPISNLFRSIDALNDIDYFKSNRHTDNLLKPKNYYLCTRISATYGAKCPDCRKYMYTSSRYVRGSDEARPIEGGYVKEGKFMVVDDLTVKPMPHSFLSTISILNDLNEKDIGFIEEQLAFRHRQRGCEVAKGFSAHGHCADRHVSWTD